MARPPTIEKQKLLEIARQVFLEEGAAGSIHVIAEKAGISAPAIFSQIRRRWPASSLKRRRALFVAAMMPERMDATQMMSDIPAGEPRDRLVAGAAAVLD